MISLALISAMALADAPALAVAVALALVASGCHTVRYDTGRQASPRHVEQTVHFFFWGLAGKPVIDLEAACPEGVARWQSSSTFGDWLADVGYGGM